MSLAALGGTSLGVLGHAGAVGVGLVFAHAASAKLRHRELLSGVIANYRLLPAVMVAPAAFLLPYVELAVALGLVSGVSPWLDAPIAIALLLIFAAAMGINIARGRREIDCGCGRSDLRQPLSWLLVGRNLVLAALLVPYLGQQRVAFSGVGFLVAVAGGLAVFLLYLLFNAIAALAASPLAASRR